MSFLSSFFDLKRESYSRHPASISSAKSESYENLTAFPSIIYSSMKMCKQPGLTTCLHVIPLYYLVCHTDISALSHLTPPFPPPLHPSHLLSSL